MVWWYTIPIACMLYVNVVLFDNHTNISLVHAVNELKLDYAHNMHSKMQV